LFDFLVKGGDIVLRSRLYDSMKAPQANP